MKSAVRGGWLCQEPGWWTKDGVGGICRERDGRWWFYDTENRRLGRGHQSLGHAIQFAEAPKIDLMEALKESLPRPSGAAQKDEELTT